MKSIIPDSNTVPRAGRVASHFNHPEAEERAVIHGESTEAEVKRLARAADAWRRNHGWTQTAFVESFRNLCGDRKTFGQFAEVPVDKWDRPAETWLEKYRQLPEALAEWDARAVEVPLLALSHTVLFTDALRTLRKQVNEKRALFVEGDPGSGKTALLRQMRSVVGEDRCVMIRGRQSWVSFAVMLEGWLSALGHPVKESKRPLSAARLQEKVRAALLSAGDVVITVDEAHCMHGPGMNAVRDWINDAHDGNTRVHFVFAAIPTLWDGLTGRYAVECAQVVRRFSDRLEIPAPSPEECLLLLGQRVDLATLGHDGEREQAGLMLAQRARGHGSRSLVADVRDVAAKLGAKLTLKKLTEIADAAKHKNRRA